MRTDYNFELHPGVKVKFISNKQFKSVQLMISFIREIKKPSELAKRSLLAKLLESSSEQYPNQHSITVKLAELYGATFGATTELEGNLSLLNFVYSFIAPEYLKQHDKSLLTESIEFLNQIIFHPAFKDGQFQTDQFKLHQNNLMTYVDDLIDNKQTEAVLKTQQLYFDSVIQQRAPYGIKDDYRNLSNYQVSNAYHQMINHDQVQITVMGNLNVKELKHALSQLEFSNKPRKINDHICYQQPLKSEVAAQTKIEDVQQSKLDLIYQFPIELQNQEDFFASVVMNAMLGASPQSLLFQNVREKESMAYYAESSYSVLRSFLLIQTGIQAKQHDIVLKLIKDQILDLQHGRFTVQKLTNIKSELVNERLRMQDSPMSVLEQTVLGDLLSLSVDYGEQCNRIQQVTKQDIMRVAQKLTLQAEFFLRGGVTP